MSPHSLRNRRCLRHAKSGNFAQPVPVGTRFAASCRLQAMKPGTIIVETYGASSTFSVVRPHVAYPRCSLRGEEPGPVPELPAAETLARAVALRRSNSASVS